MSDDDCDIFSKARSRAPARAMPKELCSLSNPNESFSEEKDRDYDFIDANPVSKKPVHVAKATKKGKQIANKLKAAETIEKEPPEQVPVPEKETTRALSPVSQLIFEMEQKQQNELANAPVARRTRSSLGNREPVPEKDYTPEVTLIDVTPPKRRNRGGRKEAAASVPLPTTANLTRRQQTAERAARLQVLDSIDLVSAVLPRVEGFVNLDSDEDEPAAVQPEPTENPTDFDNPIMEISLSWLGDMQVYKLRQHQKFAHLFKEVAKRNKVDLADVVINRHDHFLKPNESPHTIDLKTYHILSGRAIKSNGNNATSESESHTDLTKKPKTFQLKVQADKWKKPLVIPLKKKEVFKILYIKCAEELECDMRDIQLFFDGDLLDPEDTPKNQEMEGNEMIDLRLKK